MLKKLLLGLINRVFGLNLTESQLDSAIEFIKMLIQAFGSITEATAFMKRTVSKSHSVGHARVKQVLTSAEKTLG